MPRNNKKAKQRALDLESNDGTVISNLAANEDNSTQIDRLKSLQEMFANKIEPDLVRDVFHECAANGLSLILSFVFLNCFTRLFKIQINFQFVLILCTHFGHVLLFSLSFDLMVCGKSESVLNSNHF